MKINRTLVSLKTQRGVSLVELMITMAIGLVMLIALGYFFLGSRQINRTTDDVSRMQESGRNALEIIGKAVRQAGYRSEYNVVNGKLLKNAAGTVVSALTGTNNTATADTISVNYEAQLGGEPDCGTGTTIASGLVTYAFAVSGGSLTCNGVVLVDNIENMQIEYGIDVTKDGIIDSYTAAPSDFSQVAAVRVMLLVKGPSTNLTAYNRQTYRYYDAVNSSPVAVSVTKTDGFLRQVYSATFTVRNQAG